MTNNRRAKARLFCTRIIDFYFMPARGARSPVGARAYVAPAGMSPRRSRDLMVQSRWERGARRQGGFFRAERGTAREPGEAC